MNNREKKLSDLLGRGYTNKGCANALGVTERTVQRMRQVNPDINTEAARLQAERDPDAVEVLRRLLSDTDPNIRLKAAVALLRTPDEATDPDTQVVTLVVHRDGTAEVTDDEQPDGTAEFVHVPVIPPPLRQFILPDPEGA